MGDAAEIVAGVLGIDVGEAARLMRRRLRAMSYRGLRYIVFRGETHGFREGTVILAGREPVVVHGYPAIRRLVLLSYTARHMVDRIVVEEKMNGYNTRVVYYEGEVYAITRGGYICPYTTARIRRMYGDKLRRLGEENPGVVLAGEVVGLENPYVPVYYPEAPGFDYFVFDAFRGDKPLPLRERDRLVSEYGLRRVRILGVIDKWDNESLRRFIELIEAEGREGIVIKDPEYRVPPLKYTTVSTNIGDIEEGMRYPFDEGKGYLFPRIVRLLAQGYEEDWRGEKLEEIAKRLGMAILRPALETLRKRAEGGLVAAEYRLVFPDEQVLGEFLEYMRSLGVDIVASIIGSTEEGLAARIMKIKETHDEYTRLLKTGISPLD